MPEEIEVPLEHLHEQITEAHKDARGGKDKSEGEKSEGEKSEGEEKHEGWTRFIAVITAILAVVAAVGSLRAGLLVNEALLSKNDEISLRTQATDQWNYYQSKSIKGVVYTTTAQLLPLDSPLLGRSQAEAARYGREQAAIQAKAEGLEKRAEAKNKDAAHDMDSHHIFAFSVSLCQIAIALSAIAALTRSRRVWFFSLAAGAAGVAPRRGGFRGLHLPFAFCPFALPATEKDRHRMCRSFRTVFLSSISLPRRCCGVAGLPGGRGS